MRILFLSTRQAKPSFRFRIEQMLPYFAERGHDCDVGFLAGNALSRLFLYRRLPDYDVVVVQKRLLSRAEVIVVRRRTKRLVFDLDDAVMFNGSGDRDRRRQARFGAIVRAADLVLCGNQYLADEARPHGGRVEIVPTAIDTERFHPRVRDTSRSGEGLVTVGWTGSSSTNRYLNELLPLLAELDGTIRLKVISDTTLGLDLGRLRGVPIDVVRWSPETEVAEAAGFDVGIMPLPNNPWTRGKCGFKALQYMGLGLPAVCSPVGVNREIIEHGVTGFLPSSGDEWLSIIEQLANEPGLRTLIGRAGRRRVEEAYSTAVVGPRLAELIEGAAAERLRRTA
ncbi:MAG TPA: glycosyltransferase family 4 protein [Planctomycetaceae bacterium]|nr:glycosyltransferase family 4 protein [Planctomycetaceae bacterium]